jgi:hypothetical protein
VDGGGEWNGRTEGGTGHFIAPDKHHAMMCSACNLKHGIEFFTLCAAGTAFSIFCIPRAWNPPISIYNVF